MLEHPSQYYESIWPMLERVSERIVLCITLLRIHMAYVRKGLGKDCTMHHWPTSVCRPVSQCDIVFLGRVMETNEINRCDFCNNYYSKTSKMTNFGPNKNSSFTNSSFSRLNTFNKWDWIKSKSPLFCK